LLHQFRHPKLPIVIGIIREKNILNIIIRFHMPYGESKMLGMAAKVRRLGKEVVKYVDCIRQLSVVTEYLHRTARILHNDIKCNNVMLEGKGVPQAILIHFGKDRDLYSPKTYTNGANTKKCPVGS